MANSIDDVRSMWSIRSSSLGRFWIVVNAESQRFFATRRKFFKQGIVDDLGFVDTFTSLGHRPFRSSIQPDALVGGFPVLVFSIRTSKLGPWTYALPNTIHQTIYRRTITSHRLDWISKTATNGDISNDIRNIWKIKISWNLILDWKSEQIQSRPWRD